MKKYVFLTSTVLLFMTACGSSNNNKAPETSNLSTESGFQCEGLETCADMEDYAEAKNYLDKCDINKTKIDSDSDGIPCEKRHPKP